MKNRLWMCLCVPVKLLGSLSRSYTGTFCFLGDDIFICCCATLLYDAGDTLGDLGGVEGRLDRHVDFRAVDRATGVRL